MIYFMVKIYVTIGKTNDILYGEDICHHRERQMIYFMVKIYVTIGKTNDILYGEDICHHRKDK